MTSPILSLSFIIGTRFFGLFIVLPVLSLYALELKGANDFLLGLLIGSYALAQMLLQAPFGMLSDKIGRKKALFLGLLIFIIGSIFCALASDIYMMILGRFIQGAGAVGAVAVAMINDFVPESKRSRAFIVMGMFIGLSFAASMVLSPLLSEHFSLASLFYLSIFLTIICIILLFTAVPKEPKIKHLSTKTPFFKFFIQKDLAIMNLSNFLQKMLMSLTFMLLPLSLNALGLDLTLVYSFCILAGFVAMGLCGSLADKKGLTKAFLIIGVLGFFISYLCFDLSKNFSSYASFFILISSALFFISFNLHEPILQSCASAFVRANERGAALGVFNAFGYAGSFFGGIFGALMLAFSANSNLLFMILLVILALWLIILTLLKNPSAFKTIYLKGARLDEKRSKSVLGVIEMYQNDDFLVIKFDSKIISQEALLKALDLKETF